MSWGDHASLPHFFLRREGFEPDRSAPLSTNDICFMRRQHRCDKVFGASKSCFVACPTDDALEPLLALLEAKLAAHGVEAVIAVKERAYGQEIVCTKICGRIIESRFCVVILDEVDRDGVSIANPNVYYEYGLMTALGKHVVPLQRDEMHLAFNIQSQDTIKYNQRNMADEIERAIRDAIANTEPGRQRDSADVPVGTRVIRRRLELAGYVAASRSDPASEAAEDTQFEAFSSDSGGYLLLAKVDDAQDVANYQDDLPVLVYRLEDLRRRSEAELAALPATVVRVRQQLGEAKLKGQYSKLYDLESELDNLEKRGPLLERRLARLVAARLGFISAPVVDANLLRESTASALADTSITAIWNEGTSLEIGDGAIELGRGSVGSRPVADEMPP